MLGEVVLLCFNMGQGLGWRGMERGDEDVAQSRGT